MNQNANQESALVSTKKNVEPNLFKKLSNNLDELTKLYRGLLELVRSEKQILSESNLEKLNATNVKKDYFITQIKSLDALRSTYATEVAQAIGANLTEPRLLELAQKLGGEEGDKLRSHHSTLELLLKRLMEINKENADVAGIAIRNVNRALEGFKDDLMGQKTYQKKGQYQQGSEKSGHLVSAKA